MPTFNFDLSNYEARGYGEVGTEDVTSDECGECESTTCTRSSHYVPVPQEAPRFVCADCGEEVARAYYLYRVIGSDGLVKRICDNCYHGHYINCNRCGESYPNDRIEENENGHLLCVNCMVEEPDYCYTDDWEDEYDDDCDSGRYGNVCGDCSKIDVCAIRRGNGGIMCGLKEYNFRPNFIFHKADGDVADGGIYAEYLGFELEYNDIMNKGEVLRSLGSDASGKGKMFYAKHDGSLDDGFEIVSMPMTMKVHETVDYDKMFSGIDGDVGGNCGLHIHVNKKSLGVDETDIELVIAKLIILMNNLWDNYLLKVSRRSDMHFVEEYASELRKMNIDWRGGRELNIYRLAQAYDRYEKHDRYRALNLCNSNTIEFRFFESTFEKDDLMSCMEIVSKMIKYCKESTANQVRRTTDWKKIYTKVGSSERLEKYHARYCR